jgi:hypothetical protein
MTSMRLLFVCAALIMGAAALIMRAANASGPRRLRRSVAAQQEHHRQQQQEKNAAINAKYLDLTSEVDKRAMKRVHRRVFEEGGHKAVVALFGNDKAADDMSIYMPMRTSMPEMSISMPNMSPSSMHGMSMSMSMSMPDKAMSMPNLSPSMHDISVPINMSMRMRMRM